MAVLRESPWYREILKEGEQIGEQRGRQAGRLEGEAELVLRQLNRRLGRLDKSVQRQIRQLDIVQLEELGEQLLDFSSPEELQGWLEQQPRL
jgi:predicted transposase YdaD